MYARADPPAMPGGLVRNARCIGVAGGNGLRLPDEIARISCLRAPPWMPLSDASRAMALRGDEQHPPAPNNCDASPSYIRDADAARDGSPETNRRAPGMARGAQPQTCARDDGRCGLLRVPGGADRG
ncbi:hypothetical protein ASZ90_009706 [hydrocarbon metagenome]|uniref:Uncharacterized protein n=1 Tax=hydrocarbon metagenome TaxID=938273 RepID=A0A0W8FI45_9ZZZZ